VSLLFVVILDTANDLNKFYGKYRIHILIK